MDSEGHPVAGSSGIKRELNSAKLNATKAKSKQSMLDLVCEAIETLGTPKHGVSAQTIKKYVQNKKETGQNSNTFINKALVKGIEKGILARPKTKPSVIGATGHFVLAKQEKPKASKKLNDKENGEEMSSEMISRTTTKKKNSKQNSEENSSGSNSHTTTKKNSVKQISQDNSSASSSHTTTKKKPVKENDEENSLGSKSRITTKKKPVKQNSEEISSTTRDTERPQMKPLKTSEAKAKKLPAKKDPKTKKATTENIKEKADTSDTEIVVKKKVRKSTKSYSSDTELDFLTEESKNKKRDTFTIESKNIESKKNKKKTKAAESSVEKSDSPSKQPLKKGVKKLYFDEMDGKTRTRSQNK